MEAEAGVEISHVVSLKYTGKKHSIPEALIVQDAFGNEYLKVAATNQVILRLICGTCKKNSSLAGGQKLGELKQQRNQKAGIANAEQEDEEWPGEHADSSSGAPKTQKRSQKVVTLDIGGTDVCILRPAKRLAAADLMVKMDSAMLFAVFEFLKEDCEDHGRASRKYQRTGQYRKAGGGRDSEEEPAE